MGKLVVGIARFLLFCAVLLAFPALAAAQSVTLQPNQGTVGTEVTATGMGWPPGAVVHAFFDVGLPEVSKAPAVVDTNGRFTLKFCVPKLAPGFHPTSFTLNQAGA